jgi:hypothetical protein
MSTPARFSFSLVSIVIIAAAIVGCGKKEDEPVVMTLPSAAAVAPAKATQDPLPPPQPAAEGNAAPPPDAVATAATPTPPADAPKAAPASIESCCSALAGMVKDAKLDAVTKSKATAAAGMCNATAPLVKSGKAPRSSALSQIKATMAGKAPSACN